MSDNWLFELNFFDFSKCESQKRKPAKDTQTYRIFKDLILAYDFFEVIRSIFSRSS